LLGINVLANACTLPQPHVRAADKDMSPVLPRLLMGGLIGATLGATLGTLAGAFAGKRTSEGVKGDMVHQIVCAIGIYTFLAINSENLSEISSKLCDFWNQGG
jgi:hypothetical protein